jgi:hypothetical protein
LFLTPQCEYCLGNVDWVECIANSPTLHARFLGSEITHNSHRQSGHIRGPIIFPRTVALCKFFDLRLCLPSGTAHTPGARTRIYHLHFQWHSRQHWLVLLFEQSRTGSWCSRLSFHLPGSPNEAQKRSNRNVPRSYGCLGKPVQWQR